MPHRVAHRSTRRFQRDWYRVAFAPLARAPSLRVYIVRRPPMRRKRKMRQIAPAAMGRPKHCYPHQQCSDWSNSILTETRDWSKKRGRPIAPSRLQALFSDEALAFASVPSWLRHAIFHSESEAVDLTTFHPTECDSVRVRSRDGGQHAVTILPKKKRFIQQRPLKSGTAQEQACIIHLIAINKHQAWISIQPLQIQGIYRVEPNNATGGEHSTQNQV